ncbi:MAG: hypothetical protein AB1630_07370 [bacterium]
MVNRRLSKAHLLKEIFGNLCYGDTKAMPLNSGIIGKKSLQG